jgi:hypothetical protein
MYRRFRSENVKGKYHSEDLSVDMKIILDWIFGKWGESIWTGCTGLTIGTSDGLL